MQATKGRDRQTIRKRITKGIPISAIVNRTQARPDWHAASCSDEDRPVATAIERKGPIQLAACTSFG